MEIGNAKKQKLEQERKIKEFEEKKKLDLIKE